MTEARWDDRSRRLLGEEAYARLRAARVLVAGVGGVGGYAAEMLVRSGVGDITLVDSDAVDITNLNRQITATLPELGQPKTAVMARRAAAVNPELRVTALQTAITPGNVPEILDRGFDYVLDCIDTVAPKVELLAECLRRRRPVVSSMGAGGRLDPSRVIYTDLWKTENDGLARAVRTRLRRLGLRRPLPVVASTEPPCSRSLIAVEADFKRSSYGTLAAVPATFGIFMAAHVIRKITCL